MHATYSRIANMDTWDKDTVDLNMFSDAVRRGHISAQSAELVCTVSATGSVSLTLADKQRVICWKYHTSAQFWRLRKMTFTLQAFIHIEQEEGSRI